MLSGGTVGWFSKPAPRRGTKVKSASGAKRHNFLIFSFPRILGPSLDSLLYFRRYFHLPLEGSQNPGYAWGQPSYDLVKLPGRIRFPRT